MDSNRKKVLIYSPMSLWTFHHATELEIAQKNLDEGNEVFWIRCQSELPVCQVNLDNFKSICMTCEQRSRSGLNWLQGERLHVLPVTNICEAEMLKIQNITDEMFVDMDSVKNYRVDGIDIGLAVLSSLISQLREPKPDILKYQKQVLLHTQAALAVYYSIRRYISEIVPDEIILFNGRFAVSRPVLRVAQEMGIKIFTHERVSVKGKYSLVENNYPHELEPGKQDIIRYWRESNLTEKEKISQAVSWYKERRKGLDQGWYSWVASQQSGKVPLEYDENKINIAIFISSEDEFSVLEGWENLLYEDQNKGIRRLVEDFSDDDQYRFYIRMHPCLAGVNNSQTRGLEQIGSMSDHAYIIDANSNVDTYALMDAVDIVITFGTTVGIEAVYIGKISILLGRTFYEDLEGVIVPKCHEEVVEYIRAYKKGQSLDDNSSPLGAYIYGFYHATAGNDFKYVRQDEVKVSGVFRGQESVTYDVALHAKIIWLMEKALRKIGISIPFKRRIDQHRLS